jgi:polyisoprenoid-binding protein YceI
MTFARSVISITFVTALCASRLVAADTYDIDAVHTCAIFRISHLGLSTQWGRINLQDGKAGTIAWDAADTTKCAITIVLPATGVDTANAERDDHLKGPLFFDAKQFPELKFTSKEWKKTSDGFDLSGDFSLHGVTKKITVKVVKVGEGKDPVGNECIGFDTSFTIKRSEYGMTMLAEGGMDEVWIAFSVAAIKRK